MAFELNNKLHTITLPNVIEYITITFHCHLRGFNKFLTQIYIEKV